MTLSFRTRLFLSATLMVVSVLALVLGLGSTRLLAFEQRRLDTRMCLEARRLAARPLPLQRLATDIAAKLHLTSTQHLRLRQVPSAGPGLPDVEYPEWTWPDDHAGWTALQLGGPDDPRPAPAPASNDGEPPPPAMEPGSRRSAASCAATTVSPPKGPWRVVRFGGSDGTGYVAVDQAAARGELDAALRNAAAWVVPLALLLAASGAGLLSVVMMRPLNRLRAAMGSVTREALDRRLPTQGEPREIKALMEAYNAMLERLELSFHQASRFSADAAHELKTPLTILRGRIEQAVNQSDHRAIQADLTAMLDEVGSLSAITRKLLLLSQADAGQLALNREPLDLSELLEALVSDARMLAPGRQLTSHVEARLQTHADKLLLRQLLNNLISNAIRHGLPTGWIDVKARHRDGGSEIEVANACAPIAQKVRERLFDRFYRGEAVMGRTTEGHGLGLSLAREIARAHGGDLTLTATAPDEVRLRLWLPDHRSRSSNDDSLV